MTDNCDNELAKFPDHFRLTLPSIQEISDFFLYDCGFQYIPNKLNIHIRNISNSLSWSIIHIRAAAERVSLFNQSEQVLRGHSDKYQMMSLPMPCICHRGITET